MTVHPLHVPEPAPYTPTRIEANTYAALDALGIRYYTQYPFGVYTVDAYLPAYGVVIECDGCEPHCCPECGFYLSQVDEAHRKYDATAYRDHVLRNRFNVRTIHVWGHHLLTPDAALATMRDVLERYISQPTGRRHAKSR